MDSSANMATYDLVSFQVSLFSENPISTDCRAHGYWLQVARAEADLAADLAAAHYLCRRIYLSLNIRY
jgi:tRNA U34 5-methylaminomethyl-2-thiouridine-forming methyltransferase MnmC